MIFFPFWIKENGITEFFNILPIVSQFSKKKKMHEKNSGSPWFFSNYSEQ